MAETPARRSALAECYRPGPFGAGGEPGVVLREVRGLAIAHVAARAGDGAFAQAARAALGVEPPTAPNTTAGGGGVRAHWLGPDRWMVTSAGHAPATLEAALAAAGGAVNDATHGRVVVRVAGASARDLLAKGLSLDLHPRAFGAGRCGQGTLGQVGVLLAQGEDSASFELYIPRGYAEHVWEWLLESAAEFGGRVEEAPG